MHNQVEKKYNVKLKNTKIYAKEYKLLEHIIKSKKFTLYKKIYVDS